MPRSLPTATLYDRYLLALAGVLLGYALLGKGFAYIGLAPLFIGEFALLSGAVVALRTGCLVNLLAFPPYLLLAMLAGWTMLRTVPFIQTDGLDALRDSVVVIYGGFAVIVSTLLLEDPRRIGIVVSYYQRFVGIYLPCVPPLFFLSWYFSDQLPRLPGTDVPLVWLGAGEVGAHLAGIVVFVMAGFSRLTPFRWLCLAAALVLAGGTSRAAILAFVVPVSLAAVVLGKTRVLLATAAAAFVLLIAAYAAEMTYGGYQEPHGSTERRASPAQIVENLKSIFVNSGAQTESTTVWREQWWAIIMEKTINGPYFWSGRGYGPNLAEQDGFGNRHSERPLRSPHNSHLTILARGGVPSLTLWVSFLASWFGTLGFVAWRARRSSSRAASNLVVFVASYVLACAVNAAFDVALEAPMQGIWFWSMIGFGSGTAMVYRYLDDARLWKTGLPAGIIPAFATDRAIRPISAPSDLRV